MKLNHMSPLFITNYVMDHLSGYFGRSGNGRLVHAVSKLSPYLYNLRFFKFGTAIFYATRTFYNITENIKRMFDVFSGSYIFKIPQTIISFVAIFMIAFKIGWARAYKRGKDQSMCTCARTVIICTKINIMIAATFTNPWFKYSRVFSDSPSIAKISDSTKIRNLMAAFKTDDRFPDFVAFIGGLWLNLLRHDGPTFQVQKCLERLGNAIPWRSFYFTQSGGDVQ